MDLAARRLSIVIEDRAVKGKMTAKSRGAEIRAEQPRAFDRRPAWHVTEPSTSGQDQISGIIGSRFEH